MAKVLIIDDDPGVCWALRKTLEQARHEVDVAGTAEQGLPKAGEAEMGLCFGHEVPGSMDS